MRPLITLSLKSILGPSGHAQTLPKHSRDTSRPGYGMAKTTYVMPPVASPLIPLIRATLDGWTRAQT